MKLIELQEYVQKEILANQPIEGFLYQQTAMANQPCLDAFKELKKYFVNSGMKLSLHQQYGGGCFYTIRASIDIISQKIADLQVKNCMVHKQPILLVFNASEEVLQMDAVEAVAFLLKEKAQAEIDKTNIVCNEAEQWIHSLQQKREELQQVKELLSLIKA